ncbi:MAG: DUF2500 domain-containing protein [Clostridia bacterium]|nr:DUF2500 domain-containing protein [Clostridia bacterium]
MIDVMGFDVGGHLPIFGRVGEVSTGMSVLFYILLAAAVVAAVLILRARRSDGRHMELTVKACVAEKREAKNGMDYVVSFELAEGERRELRLSAAEAGSMAVGDAGRLTFRGRRFIGFDRERQ